MTFPRWGDRGCSQNRLYGPLEINFQKICVAKEQNIPLHSQIKAFFSYKDILRGGAEVARRAHNPKAVSSNLAPATTKSPVQSAGDSFFFEAGMLVCRTGGKKVRSE